MRDGKEELVIGVLGGMGTYATIHFFQQYARVFFAEKEWDRPRIIIDNRCTMPSRVRAFIYNENIDLLVDEMTDSLQWLMNAGCSRIILACNTSHLFLPFIYRKIPDLETKVVNIIKVCVERIVSDDVKEVFLLGSEGTIESCIFQNMLETQKIKCLTPQKKEYIALRKCIEAVKQDCYSNNVKSAFLELINRSNACILGCTELPILYEKYKEDVTCKVIYDPLLLCLEMLKREYDEKKSNYFRSI